MRVHIYLPSDRHTEIYFSGFKFAELEMSASCMILPIFPINSFHRACSICASRNIHILSRIQRDRMGYERPCGAHNEGFRGR